MSRPHRVTLTSLRSIVKDATGDLIDYFQMIHLIYHPPLFITLKGLLVPRARILKSLLILFASFWLAFASGRFAHVPFNGIRWGHLTRAD